MAARRRVHIGAVKGETPKKVFYFNREDAPTSIESATPERDGVLPLKGALKVRQETIREEDVDPYASPASYNNQRRPTTSRGKARPSPDEFANYVVPSPDRRELNSVANTLVFDDSSNDDRVPESDESEQSSESESESDAERVSQEKLTVFACWLFGSAFAV